MVSTAAEARFIVQAAKFPPVGIRGQGSQFSSWASGLSVGDYVKQANESILTVVQVENKAGVENVEEIVAVEGVGKSSFVHHSHRSQGQILSEGLRGLVRALCSSQGPTTQSSI